jgi:hypothetical protein
MPNLRAESYAHLRHTARQSQLAGLVHGHKQFDRRATKIRDNRFGIRQSDEREIQINAANGFFRNSVVEGKVTSAYPGPPTRRHCCQPSHSGQPQSRPGCD